MSRLASVAALEPRRRRLLLGTLVLIAIARAGLAASSYHRTSSVLRRLPTAEDHQITRTDVRWAVTTAADQLPGTTCLPRAIVAHALCRRYGYEAELYVGVDSETGDFAAHSWVESDGEVLVGDDVDLDRFERLGEIGT